MAWAVARLPGGTCGVDVLQTVVWHQHELVIAAGASDRKCSHMAMEVVDQRLVRRDHTLIQLLDPPFDKSTLNPGYIKIAVWQTHAEADETRVTVDDVERYDKAIPLVDGLQENSVEVRIQADLNAIAACTVCWHEPF